MVKSRKIDVNDEYSLGMDCSDARLCMGLLHDVVEMGVASYGGSTASNTV